MKQETLEEGIALIDELNMLETIKGELDDTDVARARMRSIGCNCTFLHKTPGLRRRFYNDVVEEIKIVKDKIEAL